MPISILPGTFQINPNVFSDSKGRLLYAPGASTPPVSDQVKDALTKAIHLLANNCDGAQTDDGVGFNKSDTIWGHRVSGTLYNAGKLSDSQSRYMMKRLRKYKNQLPQHLVETIWG